MSSNNQSNNQSSLARFAFNIYGALNQASSQDTSNSASPSNTSLRSKQIFSADKLVYKCEKEVSCVSSLKSPLSNSLYNDSEHLYHAVVGGKNYLKILALDLDQTQIRQEINVVESANSSTRASQSKFNNINTIKTSSDTIACGLSNGVVSGYQISNNGRARQLFRFSDHKRTVNSLDFNPKVDVSNLLISGSQDGSIKLWDLRTATNRPELTVVSGAHSDPVRSCQFSPHSTSRNKLTVLSAHDSGTLCMHDLRSPGFSNQHQLQQQHAQLLHPPERRWTFHTGPALSLSIHPEREYVISGGRDRKVCVWNYGRGTTSVKTSPDYVVNLYAPVMKVRWSPYAVDLKEDYNSDDRIPFEEDVTSGKDMIYKYDFACSFLNEDPTLAVFNLKRKHIPKEIVTSKRPFQNFIWAKNYSHSRRLWTISKSNVFVGYNLDHGSYGDFFRPLDDLNDVALDWDNKMGDFSFASNDKSDFDIVDPDGISDTNNDSLQDFPIPEEGFSDEQPEASPLESPSVEPSSFPFKHTMFSPGGISTSNSFKSDRSSFPKMASLQNRISSPKSINKFPSTPIENQFPRPSLDRTHSQSTLGSVASNDSPMQPHQFHRRPPTHTKNSPHLLPVSLPLPMNDDDVFVYLSSNYLKTVPDGFSLYDVCLINARIAASAHRSRASQTWRVIAVGLSQHKNLSKSPQKSKEDKAFEKTDENVSISSELENVVGSYNSNSSVTSNFYNGAQMNRTESPEKYTGKKLTEIKNPSNASLSNSIVRGSSFSPSRISPANEAFFKYPPHPSNESVLIDEREESVNQEDDGKEDQNNKSLENDHPKPRRRFSAPGESTQGTSRREPVQIPSGHNFAGTNKQIEISPQNKVFMKRNVARRHNYSNSLSKHGEDLDDENFNILSKQSLGSYSSVSTPHESASPQHLSHSSFSYGSHGSYFRRGSNNFDSVRPNDKFFKSKLEAAPLEEVREQEEKSVSDKGVQTSALTRAISKVDGKSQVSKAWDIENLLEQALEYATLQGDIVFCCACTFLFYESFDLGRERCLEWLALYLDILQRKSLFVTMIEVLNNTPSALISELASNKEISLRFFCYNCQSLIVNEKRKTHTRGFWYCDVCRKMQSNCIYCNEPCQGLNTVVSLRCGHRGHFGCLKQWFIEDENCECPGGCNYSIL